MRKDLRDELEQNTYVGDMRGMGIGIDFVKNKAKKEKNNELVEKAFQNSLYLVSDHESNIQLCHR